MPSSIGKQSLRIKNSARTSDKKQTTFGAPGTTSREHLQADLDVERVRESPASVADQLERELPVQEQRMQESTMVDQASIKQWCYYNQELVNKAIFYVDQSSSIACSSEEKQRLIDRLYYVKMRIKELLQRILNPR